MSRTSTKYWRVYAGGYDLSGYTREIGPLATEFEHSPQAALSDTVLGALPGHPSIKVGSLNAFLDSSASGLHALHATPGSAHVVTVALGIAPAAAPGTGDPVFAGEWTQTTYAPSTGDGAVAATVAFGEWAANAGTTTLAYERAWGVLLHPNAAETGPNNGNADHDNGAATSGGGYAILHGTGGDGLATVSIEAAATDSDAAFDAAGDLLAFAETDFTTPFASIVALGTTASVARYLRFQVSLNTATSVSFVLSFVRGA